MLNNSKYKRLCVCIICSSIIILNVPHLFAANVTLYWDTPTENTNNTPLTDLEGFIVHFGTEPGNYSQSIDVGNITTCVIDNLVDGFIYYFAVVAYNSLGNQSDYSDEISINIQGSETEPPVISGVHAKDITFNSVSINWTTNKEADSQVEYGTTLLYGYSSSLDSSLVQTHEQTIYVAPSTQYYYRVLSRDAFGNLANSQNYSFISSDQPDLTPPVIYNVHATNITPSSALISWMTDEDSTSQVEHGFGPYYGNVSLLDSNLVTVHSTSITELASNSIYNFRVRSMDSGYNEALSENYTFATSNLPPIITVFSANPKTALISEGISFEGSATDSDGFIVKYDWDFDGDGNYDSDTGAATSAFYIYNNAGIYNARLRVTDNGGASSLSNIETVVIESMNNQPPVTISLTANSYSGVIPLSIIFTAYPSEADLEVVTYEWDFDGNGAYEVESTTNPISNTYNRPGTYVVRVRVTDIYGRLATNEVEIRAYKNSNGKKGTSSGDNGKKNGYRNK